MADRDPLAPAELDRLEDLLDELEDGTLPEDVTETVRKRLASYRNVSAVVHREVPLEAPPERIFEHVLAQARASTQSGASDAQRSGGTEREKVVGVTPWYRMWVPGIALAGAAVLILWWVRPEVDTVGKPRRIAEPGAHSAGQREPGQAETPKAVVPRAQKGTAAAEESALDYGEDGRPAADRDAPEAAARKAATRGLETSPPPAEESRPRRPSGSVARERAKKSPSRPGSAPGGSRGSGAAADATLDEAPGALPPASAEGRPGPASQPSHEKSETGSAGVTVTMAAVQNAHAQRRGGRCGLARLVYQKAVGSNDPEISAHGHAGLGLCEEAAGGDGSPHWVRARQADPRIRLFIQTERDAARR